MAALVPNIPVSPQRQLEYNIENEQQQILASGIDPITASFRSIAENSYQRSDWSFDNVTYHLTDIVDLIIHGEIMKDSDSKYLPSNIPNLATPIHIDSNKNKVHMRQHFAFYVIGPKHAVIQAWNHKK